MRPIKRSASAELAETRSLSLSDSLGLLKSRNINRQGHPHEVSAERLRKVFSVWWHKAYVGIFLLSKHQEHFLGCRIYASAFATNTGKSKKMSPCRSVPSETDSYHGYSIDILAAINQSSRSGCNSNFWTSAPRTSNVPYSRNGRNSSGFFLRIRVCQTAVLASDSRYFSSTSTNVSADFSNRPSSMVIPDKSEFFERLGQTARY